MPKLRSVCVFCASSLPRDPRYREVAVKLGTTVAERGLTLVYGGGSVGLMGALADAAMSAGGHVTGVMPVGLSFGELAHPGLTELREVASMHERKRLMYDLADGFIALPGGLGTLEELAEVSTWTQLGLHAKWVALLDVAGFWEPLAQQLDLMVEVGVLKPANRHIIRLTNSPEEALATLEEPPPQLSERGISEEQR